MLLSGYKRNHEYMKVQASMTAGVLEADAAQENAAYKAGLTERRDSPVGQHDITVQVMNKEQLEAVLRTAHNNVSRIYISTELSGMTEL